MRASEPRASTSWTGISVVCATDAIAARIRLGAMWLPTHGRYRAAWSCAAALAVENQPSAVSLSWVPVNTTW